MKKWHWAALLGITLFTVFIQIFVPYSRPKGWDIIPLAYAVYGFLGCMLIIFVSKWLGKVLIQKDEKFYDTF